MNSRVAKIDSAWMRSFRSHVPGSFYYLKGKTIMKKAIPLQWK